MIGGKTMTRIFRTLSIGLVLLAVTLSGSSESTLSGTAGAERPNIIFILTDDQDASSIAFMPKLKALLMDQGVSFSNFFVSFPLCCPSRATILRGQYAHNTQILGNRPPDGGFEKFYSLGEENSTIATWLKAVGYRTMYVGKYLNGYPGGVALTHVPPGWDEWYSAVRGNAYGEYNYTLNENGRLVTYGNKPEDYGTDVYARKSVDFIQRTAKEGKPFFIHLSVYAPHSPATPAPRHENLFLDAKAPRTPNFNEEDVSDKPAHIRNRPILTDKEIAQIDEQYRKRLQSLQAVDDAIASLVDTLKATEQLDKTYIFFTSDNGFHLGNHRLMMGKIAPYEEDIRVPLIVRGPGVPVGRTVEHLTGNVDLALTWAELAGAKAPDFVDGRSLVSLLGDNPPSTDSWRQAFLLENGNLERGSQGLAIPPYRAIRTKEYLYVEYNTGERELYDFNKDPYELQSLHATADPALIKQLTSRLEELRRCAAASCRATESAPLLTKTLSLPALLMAQSDASSSSYPGPLFDAHTHLSSVMSSPDLVALLRNAGLSGVFLFFGPPVLNDITLLLNAQKQNPDFVFPFALVPRDPQTRQLLLNDATLQFIEQQLNTGVMRGIGEVSLRHNPDPTSPSSAPADHPIMLKIYDLAASRKIPVTVHVEYEFSAELERALAHNRSASIIWAHMGDGQPPLIRDMLSKHANLYVDISTRNPFFQRGRPISEQTLTNKDDSLKEGWRSVFEEFSDHFLFGLDIGGRTDRHLWLDQLVAYYRSVLGQLTPQTAEKIAYRNAQKLLGVKLQEGKEQLPAPASDCLKTSVGFTPLNDLGSGQYKRFAGGVVSKWC
jgi:arylsulfatase A-like enzyme/predicted TIM-barrel fold metal-dependent hydrolase